MYTFSLENVAIDINDLNHEVHPNHRGGEEDQQSGKLAETVSNTSFYSSILSGNLDSPSTSCALTLNSCDEVEKKMLVKEPSSIISCPIVRHRTEIDSYKLSESRAHMSEEELFNIDNLSPFKTWNFTSFLLPQPSSGTEAHKNTLALDLDETLIFASTVPIKNADAVITVHVPPTSSSADEPNNSEDHSATVPLPSTPNSYRLYIRYRPFLREFLQYVIQHYEVIIFTASRYYYCGAILKQMEQDFPNLRFMKPGADAVKLNRTAETEKQYVTVLHRNHCTPTNAGYIKDLHLLGRSLKRTVLIDNNAVCGAFQPYNSLLIKDYVGEVDTTSAEAANDTAASLLKEVKGYNANQAPSTEFKDSRSDDTVLKDLIRPGGLMECLSTTDDIPFTLTKTMEYNILIGKSTQIGGPIRKEN